MVAINLKLKTNGKKLSRSKKKERILFDNPLPAAKENDQQSILPDQPDINSVNKKTESFESIEDIDGFLDNIPIIKTDSKESKIANFDYDATGDYSDIEQENKTRPSTEPSVIKKKVKTIKRNTDVKNDSNGELTSLVDYPHLSEIEVVKLKIDKQVDLQIISEGKEDINIPAPLYSWLDFGIPPIMYTNFINNLQFEKPTLIQAISYPIITNNLFNFIGISPTGTGKTLSYILPIIKKMILADPKKETISIIIAPTRELTQQIYNQFVMYLHKIDIIDLILTNPGQDISKEIAQVKKCTRKKSKYIVISTPGRLIDLMTLNNGNVIDINSITDIIMDECDRLLDLGFAPQVKNILNSVSNSQICSKLMFSATMPHFLETFAYNLLSRDSNKKLIKCTVGSINKCKESILQEVIVVSDEVEKYQNLVNIIESKTLEPLVVFVKTQITCDDIGSRIDSRFYQNNNIYLLHAGRSDEERSQVIDDFKLNCKEFKKNNNNAVYKRPVLFCTQLLSRGLDIPEINLILIYNALNSESQYVHTVGRTGRFENENGVCVTMLNENETDCAQVLYKQIISFPNEKSFLNMNPKVAEKLIEMNSEFWAGVENGKFKNIDQGFTGKGLANFKKMSSAVDDENSTNNNEEEIDLVNSPLLFDKKLNKFTQSVFVDSLPQFIKRELVKAANLDKIRKSTGSIITLTGTYKLGKGVLLNVTNEDKLAVLETMVVINDNFHSLREKYKRQQQQKFSI